MTAQIIRGDALHLPLADASVDLIVTSPPYFGLRSYQDGGEHYAGQIGSEATPVEFVDALIGATREMVRVLRPSGSIFVNLGDKYDGTKSLMGIPARYMIRCIDELGLILRAEVIWSKPNGLPESVQDRVCRSHEQWFHFVKEPRYYSAVDEIREEYSERVIERQKYVGRDGLTPRKDRGDRNDGNPAAGIMGFGTGETNPLGKLPGSVWTIPTQPLKVPAHLGVDHFAAFPMEWPRRIITAWSPRDVCTGCGEGRRPVSMAAVDPVMKPFRIAQAGTRQMGGVASSSLGHSAAVHGRSITGYACACPEPTAPTTSGIVCDPFGGTGTTALVASVLGRHGINVDMSSDYCRLAEWRTTDPGERARAMQVDKPAAQVEGQAALFEVDA